MRPHTSLPRMHRACWLALLTFVAAPSFSEPAMATTTSLHGPTESGLQVTAELSPELLAGHKISIAFFVRNVTQKSLSFPDLSARPHLVRFLLTDANGKRQERFNTPPTQETTDRWTIPPRSQRKVQLLLPSGGALNAGDYELTIELEDDIGSTTVLGPSPLKLKLPEPLLVDGPVHAADLGSPRGSLIWLQNASDGADIYLQTGLRAGRAQANRNWHLLHLDERQDVRLTQARTADAKTRHLYWQSGKDLVYAKLQGRELEEQKTRRIGIPYPEWKIVGRGVTSGSGRLLIPIWIAAPKGRMGEIRVVVVDDRKGARFHRFVDKHREPIFSHTGVDASGAMRMLVVTDGGLNQWILRAEELPEIPGSGSRIVKAASGVKGAVYESLPDLDADKKGKGIFTWSLKQGIVEGRWLTLGGTVVHKLPTRPLPAGWTLESAFPHADTLRFTAKDPEGNLHLISEKAPRTIPALRSGESIRLTASGDAYLIQTQKKQGVVIRPLP